MKEEVDLEALEADLAGVSQRMALEPGRAGLDPIVRRALWRPFWDLLPAAAFCGALATIGVLEDSKGLVAAAIALALLKLPKRLSAARDRVREIGEPGENLFAKCAQESGKRLQREMVQLILSVPVAFGLVMAAIGVPGAELALVVAGLIVLSIPYQTLVRIPRTAAEVREARRWAGLPEDEDEEEDDDDEEEEEDDDQPVWWPLLGQSLGVAILYLGPFVALTLAAVTAIGPERVRPGIALGVLVAAWLYVWFFVVDRGEAAE